MLGPSLRIKNTPTLDIKPFYGKVKFVINAFMKNYWENLKILKNWFLLIPLNQNHYIC